MLFVHMPKTAGTWVTRRVLGQQSVRHRRAVAAVGPKWGVIRDPWSWYASFYGHATRPGVDRREQLKAWGNGSRDFRSALYGWTHPRATGVTVPERKPAVLLDHPSAQQLDLRGGGLYTALVRWHFGDDAGGWAVDVLADHARLYEALPLLGLRADPDQHPPLNQRRQEPPEWDDEMRRWVAEAEAELIARWGLTPHGPAAAPVVVP